MNNGEEINVQNISGDESNPSVGSGISDDSGIEDWTDDMTASTDQEEAVPLTQPQEKEEKQNENQKQVVNHSEKEDANNEMECIFPMLPSKYETSEPTRSDVLDENGIKGVCGIYNLGNTCFMNASIQCMIATKALNNLFLKGDVLQNGLDHTHEAATVLLFLERFQQLIHKVLSGKYSLLYPNELHAAIARLHPGFGDYKQHDAQEFLSFLLNILHDFLNRGSVKSRPRKISESLQHRPLSLPEKDFAENLTGEVSKRLKMDNSCQSDIMPMESDADAGVECEDNISKAEKVWREHACNNQSIIADSFLGQFQSVISCEKCAFVSTTYEPFMILSLPIPHAMEKQIVVTWVPASSFGTLPGMVSTTRYLVTVNKNGCMADVKKELITLVKTEDEFLNVNNILFAEVSKSAAVKILDDRTQLSYLSKTKDIYALEVLTTKELDTLPNADSDEKCGSVSAESAINSASSWHSCSICFDEIYDDEMKVHVTCGGMMCGSCLQHMGANFSCPICSKYISQEDYTPLIEPTDLTKNKDTSNTTGDEAMPSEVSAVTSASAWRSCSICLEETFDEDIRIHTICGGSLCVSCLGKTAEYHYFEKFPCPICSKYISPEEFQCLVTPSSAGTSIKRLRQVLVPIMFRHDNLNENNTNRKFLLFGHPVIASLLSEVKASKVFELVNQVLSPLSQLTLKFDVVITDGSGLSCGRCEMFSSCKGCPVTELETLMLKPGVCLAVHFHDNLETVVAMMNHCKDDKTMSMKRESDVVTLDECLKAFGEVELLTEDNPWFCPQCQANQISTKSITVTRWPEVLIVHLKRFYFEGSTGCKITCPVDYPLNELNVDVLSCVDNNFESMKSSQANYDLYAVICHTGSLYGGHYTCFTKYVTCSDLCNGNTEWYYFNDESFEKMEPSEDHRSDSYVLFYQRK